MDDPRAVPEIRDGVALLERYESSPLSYESAQDFATAVETLEDYLDENPDSPFRQFIQNIRVSYTRRLLQRLSSVKEKSDGYMSLQHATLVLHTVRTEAEKLRGEYPELGKDLDALVKICGVPAA